MKYRVNELNGFWRESWLMKECRWMKEVSINNKGDLDEKYVETLKVWEMSVMKTKNNITVGCCEEQLVCQTQP